MAALLKTLFSPTNLIARGLVWVYAQVLAGIDSPFSTYLVEKVCLCKAVLFGCMAVLLVVAAFDLKPQSPEENLIYAQSLTIFFSYVIACLSMGHYSASIFFRRQRLAA